MFTLHLANRTETLLDGVATVIATEPQEDLFAPELFLVQSQGMERMVAQVLADRFGVFCNFRFYLPVDFLASIGEVVGLGLAAAGFERRVLTWRLDQLLRELDGEVYGLLQRYLRGEDAALKRFQLARHLADTFDQYQVLRGEMLDSWERGRTVTSHAAEPWQMALWRRLQQDAPGMHRGKLLRRIGERLAAAEDLGPLLPQRVFVLGLHTMPPIFLHCLDKLSRHMAVYFMLLSPSRHYWGDAESPRVTLRRQARAPQEAFVGVEHHPLLAAFGRQGRDFHNMLLEGLEQLHEVESYAASLDEEDYCAASLLQRLQADLLEDRLPQVAAMGADAQDSQVRGPRATGEDDSIVVASCHSPLRELQVLKDYLLLRLHDDPELAPCDIVVMAPDIQDYADLIPAVFADLQHSIADRSTRQRNPFLAAFLAFLDLFSGRFGQSEVFDLLRRTEIHPQFQLAPGDLDTLEGWVLDSGVRWGLSAQQRRDDGHADFSEGSWRHGLARMLLGYAMAGEEAWQGVLPFAEIEGQGARPLGGLCRYIALLERAWEDFRHERPLAAWAELLASYAGTLFGDGEDRGLAELRAILAEPAEAVGGLHHGPVTFAVIRHWLALSASERRSSSGFLRGRLTFCSMLPMRSVPFRVICLLGLNDGAFPRPERHHTFDLMADDPRPGDRSPRADDRYQFLEALLSARRHLYLSYVGQSIRSNEELYPSTVLAELLEVLERFYAARDLVTAHPLQPYSARYFNAGEGHRLYSYDEHFCSVADALRQPQPPAGRWWQGTLAESRGAVAVADLQRFCRDPQRFFLGDILGIGREPDSARAEDSEPFACQGLDLYEVERELLSRGPEARAAALARFTAAARWPLGTPGSLAFTAKRQEVERFLDKVATLGMGEELAPEAVEMTVDGIRLSGTLAPRRERGGLLLRFGRLRGRDLLEAWLWHALAERGTPRLVTRLVTPQETVTFAADRRGPSLEVLLQLFVEGCRRPLPLLLEPALACAQEEAKSGDEGLSLAKAVKVYERFMEEGYAPDWQVLYRGLSAEEVLGGEFLDLCREVMCPLWRCVDAD